MSPLTDLKQEHRTHYRRNLLIVSGGLALLGARLVAGAGDGPIELLSWSAPGGRALRTGERLSLLAPAAARPEVRT